MIGDQTQQLQSDTEGRVVMTHQFAGDQDIAVDWNCDGAVFVDIDTQYLYQDLTKIASTKT